MANLDFSSNHGTGKWPFWRVKLPICFCFFAIFRCFFCRSSSNYQRPWSWQFYKVDDIYHIFLSRAFDLHFLRVVSYKRTHPSCSFNDTKSLFNMRLGKWRRISMGGTSVVQIWVDHFNIQLGLRWEVTKKDSSLRILGMSWGVKLTCLEGFLGVMNGGSGVSTGGVRILRADSICRSYYPIKLIGTNTDNGPML